MSPLGGENWRAWPRSQGRHPLFSRPGTLPSTPSMGTGASGPLGWAAGCGPGLPPKCTRPVRHPHQVPCPLRLPPTKAFLVACFLDLSVHSRFRPRVPHGLSHRATLSLRRRAPHPTGSEVASGSPTPSPARAPTAVLALLQGRRRRRWLVCPSQIASTLEKVSLSHCHALKPCDHAENKTYRFSRLRMNISARERTQE